MRRPVVGVIGNAHRVENRFQTQMVEHVSIEPHSAIAQWDGNGRLTVWSTLGRISLETPDSRTRLLATYRPQPSLGEPQDDAQESDV